MVIPMELKQEAVQVFIERFTNHAQKNGTIFYHPQENLQALLALDLTVSQRSKVIRELAPEDYRGGPSPWEKDTEKEVWAFRRTFKGRAIDIHLMLGMKEESPAMVLYFQKYK